MNWKRFTIITISLLALFPLYRLVQACADGGDPYDEYPSFFNPDVTPRPVYTPYFYQSYLKYYDDYYDAPPAAKLPDGNIAEWQDFTGKGVSEADLDSFIYTYSYADLKSLYYHLEKGDALALGDKVRNNGFTQWYLKNRDLEALGYLMYAKQCEPFAVSNDWEAPSKDTAKMGRLIRNGLQLQAAAKKDFFKDRFAFQVIRMAFYAGKYAQALTLYDQLMGSRSGNGYTRVRCLELRAGVLFRLKRKAEAAYTFSRVFDLRDDFKRSAYLGFDWAAGQDAGAVLKLCKTPHEQAVVQLMDGLHDYDYGLPNMQAAYEADPAIDGLDVLMTREINKVEERYQRPNLYRQRNLEASSWYANVPVDKPGSDAYKKQQEEKAKYERYLGLLNGFAQKVATEGRQQGKAFWLLASSYLCFMQGDITAYNKALTAVRNTAMSSRERDLYAVLQVLYAIRSSSRITPALEAELLPRLSALQRRQNRKPFRDVMNTMLATAYLQQQDTIRALYTLGKVSEYQDESFTDIAGSLLEAMDPEGIEAVKAFVQRSGKTDFERWLLDSTLYTTDRLNELEGTKYLRQHRFGAAVAVLQKVPSALLDKTRLPNPFIAHISDRYELDATDTGRWYNKLSFATAMVALEGRMDTDAGARFDYGTGLFSMTYYGKASDAYTYYRSSVDFMAYFNSNERKALPLDDQEYYSAYKAEQAFVQAAAMATDPALKAKSLFMAARCWQKRCPGTAGDYYYDEKKQAEYYANSLRNPYFRQLKDGYGSQPFFGRATGTCGYFRDYVKRAK